MEENIYNEAFYDLQSKESYDSAIVVLGLLKKNLEEKIALNSVFDFGCGVGSWLAAAKKVGFKQVYGTDGDYVPRDKLMINSDEFINNNLTEPDLIHLPQTKFDLAITLEVAEHLPEKAANSFINKIVATADLVLFSAAIPYQGGHGHVNENWLSYWQGKFNNVGFTAIDLLRPEIWNNQKVCWWYRQNIIVFIKNDKLGRLPVGTSINRPVDIVHPEQFLVSVHRERTNRFYSLKQDTDHFLASSTFNVNNPLSYGKEYAYKEDTNKSIETLDDLQRYAKDSNNPVLTDAIAPIVTKEFDIDSFTRQASTAQHKPEFLCIGAQKSGTTWLYEVLRQQESVWMPPIKELNFFNQLVFDQASAYSGAWRRSSALRRLHQASRNTEVNHNWLSFLFHLCETKSDVDWYSKIFRNCPSHKLPGEITPEYSMLPLSAIEAVKALNPNIKIIMILREPRARIESHLKMIKANCPDISESLLLEVAGMKSVLNRSDYQTPISNWLRVFDRSQLFIGNYDELKKSPQKFLNKIGDFLGVNIDSTVESFNKIIHKSKQQGSVSPDSLAQVRGLDSYVDYWRGLDFD
ncbi:sulfotransferase domain-containing protein [Alteromonas stellipolaris]|uniref:sulfotransferase domain-containing protein n=1 Tax=Alteromonas stellipolaris TaxID=233316 RepID=UPI001D3EDEC0|nr:sulfotransferase domain-containing protein [Alteromonas stellipolaris]MBZ2163615.1 sulfotransferase [Alteromonas stellipolaris]